MCIYRQQQCTRCGCPGERKIPAYYCPSAPQTGPVEFAYCEVQSVMYDPYTPASCDYCIEEPSPEVGPDEQLSWVLVAGYGENRQVEA